MILPYLDSNLTHNSTLACFLLVDFCRQYEDLSGQPAPITKCLLVLPLLWHQESCSEIARRQSGTGLATVLADATALRLRFRDRMTAFGAVTLQGLNLAVASKLLTANVGSDSTSFQCGFDQWPRGSKPAGVNRTMISANQRLARWFATEQAESLYTYFLGSEHAVRH